MDCKDIAFGTYDCAYDIILPYRVSDPRDRNGSKIPKIINVCSQKFLIFGKKELKQRVAVVDTTENHLLLVSKKNTLIL